MIIEKKFGAPQITKDGVTVAKEVELADAYQNTGAQLVKEVASKPVMMQVMVQLLLQYWHKLL